MQPAPNTPFWLVTEGRTISLAPGEYLLGRGVDCHICFPNDTQLSRRHARLIVTPSQVEVEDLGSSNGTWIDSHLVQHRMYLREQQSLRVGKQELKLRRTHTAQDRHSSKTYPELEAPRVPGFTDEVGLSEMPTFDGTPIAMVHRDALAMIDAGKHEEARSLVEPALQLLDRTGRSLSAVELEQVSMLALKLALVTKERYFADWVLDQHARQGALMSEATASSLVETVAPELPVDEEKARQYLSSLRPAAPEMTAEELIRCARLETMLSPRQ
jgi:hypothetical protein